MKYYLILLISAIFFLIAFVSFKKDGRIDIIKSSKLADNQNIAIGELFNKNFGNHKWQSKLNSLGQPTINFSGVILKQDSLRLNGAQINFVFSINPDSGLFRTDTIWWSYPETYLEKKRAEIGCFNEEKLIRTFKYLYSSPGNILVFNGQKWFSCNNAQILEIISPSEFYKLTEKLLVSCPLSASTSQKWQVNALANDWDKIGWTTGEKVFAFTPHIQQELKNILRNNYNLNYKLAYLHGNKPLENQDSLKILF